MPQNEPRVSNQPRLMLDTTNVIYEMADDILPKIDEKTGTQKLDRETGLPMWTAPLFGRGRALGPQWSASVNRSRPRTYRVEWDTTIPPSPEGSGWLNRCGAALGRQSHGGPASCGLGGYGSQAGKGSGRLHDRRGGHHVQAGSLERDTVAGLAVLLRHPGQRLQIDRHDLVAVLGGRLLG